MKPLFGFYTGVGMVRSEAGSFRFLRMRSTGGGSEGVGISVSEWRLVVNGEPLSLAGYTLTNLGDSFHASWPMSNINDGIAETSNAQSIGHIQGSDVSFDVMVDIETPVVVAAFQIAPQGTTDSVLYNLPSNLSCYGSANGSEWELLATFSDITSGLGPWNAGTYREFSVQ